MKESIRKYFGLSAAIVSTAVVIMLIFFCVDKFGTLVMGFQRLIEILMPILVGAIIAYILAPLYDMLGRKLIQLFGETFGWRTKQAAHAAGILAMLLTFAGAGAFVAGLLALIVPQLIGSISNLIATMPTSVMQITQKTQLFMAYLPNLEGGAMDILIKGANMLTEWVQDIFAPSMHDAMNMISAGVMGTVSFVKNFLIGLIVAVYLLSGKERFKSQMTRCLYAVVDTRWGNVIMEYARYTNQVFTGFITGKLLDSFIIFILSALILHIMNIPYALLVSVIIGVTNIIPFFGPFIGAVPCFIIILINSPLQSLYFLIFVLVLQQFDGNILGPKILGNSTGLSSFWVLFAILLFGGLFGFAGVLFGVPVFAVLAHIVEDIINRLLKNKQLPQEEAHYYRLDHMETDGHAVHLAPNPEERFSAEQDIKQGSEPEEQIEQQTEREDKQI